MNSDRPVGGSSGGHQVRILHIITRLILGGAQENTLYTVIGQQQHSDFRVTLLVGVDDGTEGSLEEKARAEGVDLMILPSLIRPIRPWTDVWATWQLYRLMKAGRYDIVHTHSSKAGIVGRVAARLAGVPIVVHTLHSLVFHEYQSAWKNRLYILLKRFCAPMTDVLISVNDMTTQGALAAGIGHPKQYVTVHSGFELDRFVDVGRQISITSAILDANCRVNLSSSPSLSFSFLGFTKTPPLPPPSGISTTAHFHVIQEERAITSRSMYFTPPSGSKYLIPPLYGPLSLLC